MFLEKGHKCEKTVFDVIYVALRKKSQRIYERGCQLVEELQM